MAGRCANTGLKREEGGNRCRGNVEAGGDLLRRRRGGLAGSEWLVLDRPFRRRDKWCVAQIHDGICSSQVQLRHVYVSGAPCGRRPFIINRLISGMAACGRCSPPRDDRPPTSWLPDHRVRDRARVSHVGSCPVRIDKNRSAWLPLTITR
ncbi:hypothetical protein MTO96_014874 [Rhipicephalus appendiculatus]